MQELTKVYLNKNDGFLDIQVLTNPPPMLFVFPDGGGLNGQKGRWILRDQGQGEETQSFTRQRPQSLPFTQAPSLSWKKSLQISRKVKHKHKLSSSKVN